MKAKPVFVAIMLVAGVCILARIAIINHQMDVEAVRLQLERENRAVSQSPRVPPPPTAPEPAVVSETPPHPDSPPPPEVPVKEVEPTNSIPQTTAVQPQPAPRPREEIQDPVAREAMALVGVDPYAEAYWLDAINDPSLSDNERQDLIEDLNENGFSGGDGSEPTVDDLPIIARRLAIIEEAAPYAMDQNNWDAFQEAYKDLLNMYVDLGGQ